MKIDRNITIHLSEDEVKEIIAKHLQEEGYEVKVEDVTLSVGTKLVGFGMGEHSETYFQGASACCKNK